MSLGFGVLASCAEKPLPPPHTAAVKPPPPPPPAPPKPRIFPLPAHKPTPPPENAASLPEPRAESATPAAPAPAPTFKAAELVGLDQPAARRLLGPATEQSEAPPASIWRYRTATCEFDLFFYLDLRSGKMRALNYAFKGDHAGDEDCLRSVVAAHGT